MHFIFHHHVPEYAMRMLHLADHAAAWMSSENCGLWLVPKD